MKALAVFLFLSSLCFGESLDVLIRKALEQNPELTRLDHLVEGSREAEKSAGLPENPRLSAGVNDILSNDPYRRDLEPMQTQSIQLSQSLPLTGRLGVARTIASQRTERERLLKEQKELQLAYEVKKTVYGIVKLKNDLSIISRYDTILDKLIDVHTLYNIESRTHYQMAMKSTILKAGIGVRRSRTESSMRTLENQLQNLVNGTVVSVEHVLTMQPVLSLEIMRRRVAESNPSLNIARQEVRIAREENRLAEKLKVPDLSVGVGYYQRDAFDDYYAVNLSLPLPLYGKEEQGRLRSLEQLQAEKSSLEAAANGIDTELSRTYYGMVSAKEEYALLKDIVVSQQEIVDSLSKKIESKQSSLQEGYEMLKEMLESEFSLNETLYQFNIQQAYGAMLMGEGQ